MRSELASALGFYSPTFFRIILATDDKIENALTLSDSNTAAFMHEYIHFLQDLTTTYGLLNISYIVDFIKSVNENQKAGKSRIMNLPYILSAAKDKNAFYNSKLVKLYTGSTHTITEGKVVGFTIIPTTVEVPDDKGLRSIKLPRFQLDIESSFGQTFQYSFGSHSIMESMAYEFEIMTNGKILPSAPYLPYSGARAFADLLLPGFTDNPLNIIALCDLSLMDFHPAHQFYYILLEIRSGKIHFDDPRELYPIIMSRTMTSYHGFTTNDDLFSFISTTACSQLTSYFTTDYFGHNKIWFDYLFTKAAILRRKTPHFILELASKGPLKNNPAFQFLFLELGIPALINKKGQVYFYLTPNLDYSTMRPEMIWAIQQIFNMYLNTRHSRARRCGLEDFCRNSCSYAGMADITDDRCLNAPWERINDPYLCVFTQIWKSWGMDREIPTFS